MDAITVKKILFEDHSKIEDVLESIGCSRIKILRSRVQCARPNGNNPASVQVLTDDSKLATVVHTDNMFKGKDIISLVEYYMNVDFNEAIKHICSVSNIVYSSSYKPKKKLFGMLDLFTSSDNDDHENDHISELALEEHIMLPHKKFTEQGVSVETQLLFQTGYDILDDRLLFAVRDETGKLLTIKGRTLIDNHKELGIAKFLSYHKYNSSSILYGLYENKDNIAITGELIIVEAEKSVKQLHSMDVKNSVALSKKKISDRQLKLALSLNARIIIALDKDVSAQEVIEEADKFNGFANVEIIWDWDDYLGDNDSPSDNGKFVWDYLYESRVTIDEFKRRAIEII